MKYFQLFIVLLALFIGCKQKRQPVNNLNPIRQTQSETIVNDKQAIAFLTDFYIKYYGEHRDKKGIENYVSKRLLNRMDSLTSRENLELDYDPFIQGQDWDSEILIKTLEIKPLKNENEYRVSFLRFENRNEEKTNVDFILNIDEDGKFRIYSILNDEYLNFKNEKSKKRPENNQKLSLKEEGENLKISNESNEVTLKNVIVNEISLSTSYGLISSDEFYLMYENNASAVKSIEIYKFNFGQGILKLQSKELLKFGSEGISDNLFFYENKLVDNSYGYEKLNKLESNIGDNFTKNPIKQNIFRNSKHIELKIIKDESPENYFIDKTTFD